MVTVPFIFLRRDDNISLYERRVIFMFKDKKMRKIVEQHLRQIDTLLAHAKEDNLNEAASNYASQKLALEYVLRDFDKLES